MRVLYLLVDQLVSPLVGSLCRFLFFLSLPSDLSPHIAANNGLPLEAIAYGFLRRPYFTMRDNGLDVGLPHGCNNNPSVLAEAWASNLPDLDCSFWRGSNHLIESQADALTGEEPVGE